MKLEKKGSVSINNPLQQEMNIVYGFEVEQGTYFIGKIGDTSDLFLRTFSGIVQLSTGMTWTFEDNSRLTIHDYHEVSVRIDCKLV